MHSIKDVIRRLTGQRAPNRDPADILRTLATLRFAIDKTGLSLDAFARQHVDRRYSGSSNLIYRWARGETSMSENMARRLDARVAGVYQIHSHPVFELLREPSLEVAEIHRLLSRYTSSSPRHTSWWFGDEEERGVVASPLRTETSLLVQRGDLDGFTVILGLVREAEVQNDLTAHIDRFADLYRAFAGAARVSWLKPFRRLLRHCVQTVQFKSFHSALWWRVDWKTIDRQIRAVRHETVRHKCPRDPKTYQFILPKDPISMAIERPPEIIRSPLEKGGWAAKAFRVGLSRSL
ncbi:MAG: hypothetical protein ACJ8R9_04335 [Steroidobacteraceae bacterium]